MLKLKKIAITGGIASGKSSVCQLLKELGAFVVNADAIVHELLLPDTDLGKQVIRLLGPEILDHGKISRKAVAEKVFSRPQLLKALEELLHPAVLRRIEELYEIASKERSTLFVVEIPLLFEIGAEGFYDVIVTVIANEDTARHRFKKVGFHEAEYDRRMKHQLLPSHKTAHAHYTLTNNGSFEELRKQVIALNQTLQKHP